MPCAAPSSGPGKPVSPSNCKHEVVLSLLHHNRAIHIEACRVVSLDCRPPRTLLRSLLVDFYNYIYFFIITIFFVITFVFIDIYIFTVFFLNLCIFDMNKLHNRLLQTKSINKFFVSNARPLLSAWYHF